MNSPETEISQEWCNTLKILNDFIQSVPNACGKVDPVECQLSIPWDEAAPSTQRYYKQKGSEIVNLVIDCLSPGEATSLLAKLILREDAKVKRHRKKDDESGKLSRLISLYKEANTRFIKQQILSAFVNDYTKAHLQQLIPGSSIWAIDEARIHAALNGIGKPLAETERISHIWLDPTKVDHFIDFISRPDFYQDVVYGMKTLKLSNCEDSDCLKADQIKPSLLPENCL